MEEVREIRILRKDDCVRFARRLEDWEVLCLAHAQVPHGLRRDAERLRDPSRQTWRKLGIYPDGHAASTEWSIRLDAY